MFTNAQAMIMSIISKQLFSAFLLVLVLGPFVTPRGAQAQDCELGEFGCGHAQQHREYEGWKPKSNNGNCCNGEDCRPVRARAEWDGSWSVWIPEFSRWLPVPDFAVGEPDRFGDGRSHVCSSRPMPPSPTFHIFCFSPTGSKS
jgi:hypothetical protein